jgi:hypothetical protein
MKEIPVDAKMAVRIAKFYLAWKAMHERCRDPKRKDYYGRGIMVCDRWKNFDNFYYDMGLSPPGKSLDRTNNDKGYSPENCRWATSLQQNQNRRNNRLIAHGGKILCLSEWAREVGVDAETLTFRLENWPLEKALSCPKGGASKVIDYEGEKFSISALAIKLGISHTTLWQRLKKMPLAEAIKFPHKGRRIIEFGGKTNSMTGWAKALEMSANALKERIQKYGVARALTTPKGCKFNA